MIHRALEIVTNMYYQICLLPTLSHSIIPRHAARTPSVPLLDSPLFRILHQHLQREGVRLYKSSSMMGHTGGFKKPCRIDRLIHCLEE